MEDGLRRRRAGAERPLLSNTRNVLRVWWCYRAGKAGLPICRHCRSIGLYGKKPEYGIIALNGVVYLDCREESVLLGNCLKAGKVRGAGGWILEICDSF